MFPLLFLPYQAASQTEVAPVPTQVAPGISLQFVPIPKRPDYDAEVLVPLHKAQAEELARKQEDCTNQGGHLDGDACVLPPPKPTYPQPVENSSVSGDSYTRGQCTWFVASQRSIPDGWGNAGEWLYRAQAAGWATGSEPRVGAVAWVAGSPGHVALVIGVEGADVLVREMNYEGPFIISQRLAPAASFQYIY